MAGPRSVEADLFSVEVRQRDGVHIARCPEWGVGAPADDEHAARRNLAEFLSERIEFSSMVAGGRGSLFVPDASGERIAEWLRQREIDAQLRARGSANRDALAVVDVLRDFIQARSLIETEVAKVRG
jgi:hypothetical protein